MSGFLPPYEGKPRRKGSDRVLIVLLVIFSALFVRSIASSILNSRPKPLPPIAVNEVLTATSSPLLVPATPVRLQIPSIRVDANIQSLGKNAKGQMDVPHGDKRYTEAGWYNLGAKPGDIGSAVIDGHLDTYNLLSPGVFHDLDKLIPGDMVEVIDASGTLFRFTVTGSTELAYDADPSSVFLSTDGKAHLNLITCSGDWQQSQKQYDKRLVVFTELIR